MRPRLLDLFCCQGGAAKGYANAGFDVVGVDIEPQPRYPFEFHQGDALTIGAELLTSGTFAAVHASPPCQEYSITRHSHDRQHPALIEPARELLKACGRPWVMENVPGAPMPGALVLCGSEFGLQAHDPATGRTVHLKRHRLFESSITLWGAGGCNCSGRFIAGVYGGGSSDNNHAKNVRRGGYTPAKEVRANLLGCDWMTMHGQAQAIPPAYTEFIGEQLIAHLESVAA